MEGETRSAYELVRRALADPNALSRIKTDPAPELQRLATEVVQDLPPLQTDKWIYRVVVCSLGITVVCVVLGAIVLTGMKFTELPELLTAIGSAAVGALAGLLAPSPARG